MLRNREKKPNYVQWTAQDLVTAIQNRTGKAVQPSPRKSDYIQALEAIRRKPPGVFRFLDLPAEMRNNVYEELLPARQGTPSYRVTHTPILRTSKAIYREAAQIFYQDTHVDLEISKYKLRYTGPGRVPRVTPLSRVYFEHALGDSIFCHYFRHIQNVTVTIAFQSWMHTSGDDSKWHVREVVAFWPILVGKCEDLRSLKVVVICRGWRRNKDEGRKVMLEMLAPLRETYNQGKLKLEGLSDPTKQEFLESGKSIG